jgi:hypothetical protein
VARREYLRSVKQLIELRQRELDNLRSQWGKECDMTEQSTLKPLVWASDGFEYSADGFSGEFSLLPYNSPVSKSESWILRGRRHGYRDWRYFGCYESLGEAQEWAATVDAKRLLFSGLRDE